MADGVFPAADRWASLVWSALVMTEDPRVLGTWARAAYVSLATLRMRCYTAGASPKKSLDLARVLRAVARAPELGCCPGDLLDTRDPRTLRALLRQAAVPLLSGHDACPTPLGFVDAQRFVRSPLLLQALRSVLKRPLPAFDSDGPPAS